MRTFDEARAFDALSVPVQLARANLMVRTGQLASATTLVDEMVRLSPDNSAAWNLKASVAHLKGDLRAALAGYEKAIALNPNNLDARAALAGILLDLDRLDDADKAVAELLRVSPREPRGAYLRAVIASRRNDSDTMRKSLADAVALIDAAPKKLVGRYGQLLLVAGLSHYGLGNMEKASEYLAAYVMQYPKQPGPSKLLASIYLDRGDPARAIALLEPLQASAQNDPQLLSLLAAAYMTDKRYTAANDLLDRAVRVSGGTPGLRADFGVSLIATGQAELGFSQLQQAFAKDPGQARAGVVLATWHLKRGEPKKALEVIEAVVRRDPRNVDATNLLGVVRVAAGDRTGGRAAYEKALALNPRYQPARLNLVRLDIADGKPDAARLRLTELLKVNANDGDAMYEFALLEEKAGRPAEAVAWLEKARAIPKHRLRAGIYLTELLVRQRNYDRAVAVAKDVVGRAQQDFSALRALSRAELAAGNSRAARHTLSTMVPLAGFDPALNVEIARLQFEAGDRDGAVYSLDKVLKSRADYLPALELLTDVEIRNGDYAKAEQHARGISERYPARGLGLRLMGDLAVARSQFGPAITSYRASLAKEKSVDTVLRLYRAHVLAGDTAKGTDRPRAVAEGQPGRSAGAPRARRRPSGERQSARGPRQLRAAVEAPPRRRRGAEQPRPGRAAAGRQGGTGVRRAGLPAREWRSFHRGHARLGPGPAGSAGPRGQPPARGPPARCVESRNPLSLRGGAGLDRPRGRGAERAEGSSERRGRLRGDRRGAEVTAPARALTGRNGNGCCQEILQTGRDRARIAGGIPLPESMTLGHRALATGEPSV